MAKYIVIENGEFKAIEAQVAPLNFVYCQLSNVWYNSKYFFVDNDVYIKWGSRDYDTNWLKVEYRNKDLLHLKNLKIQNVIDILTKYKSISEVELNELYNKTLKEEKSDLEKEVEQLKEEKQKAIEEVKTYTEIVKKGKDILALIKGLDEDQKE